MRGEDADLFVLSAANLRGPNEPRDLKFKNPPDFETPGDADGDSVYKVTVVATDESDDEDTMDVTVFVRNVQEDGELTLSSAGSNADQPTVGAMITAEVADPDNDVTLVTWQWSTAATIDAVTSTPIMGATQSTYTPVDADDGLYLRAHAVYTDTHSQKDDLTTPEIDERVQWLSSEGVRAKEPNAATTTIDGSEVDIPCCQYRVTATSKFAVRVEQNGGDDDDEMGGFTFGASGASFTRMVAENARIGTRVGDPVTADGATSYTLSSSTGDDANFEISQHGQITVKNVDPNATEADDSPRMRPNLDYEDKATYAVLVEAEDANGRTALANVAIELIDLNEMPYFVETSRDADNGLTDEVDVLP